MNFQNLFLFFFICNFSLITQASSKKRELEFGADLTVESFIEFGSTSSYEADLYLRYKKKLNKHLGLILHPHLDLNKYENSKGQSYLLRTENSGLYANYNHFSLTAGYLSHSFGLSQLFSPLNFVDTVSYWSPLNAKKITSPTLRFMYKTKKIRFFASYMPKRFENILPGNKTPWIPTKLPESLSDGGDTLLLPDEPNYTIGRREIIDNALDNNFVTGFRLKLKPFLAQIIYYQGVDTDPTVDLNLTLNTIVATEGSRVLQIESPINVIPIYQKVKRLGLSVRYTLPFKWRLLYEGNISKGDENVRQGYRESQTHTAGLEWGVPIGKTLLLGVIQAYKSINSNESSLGFVSPFKEAYLFGANWKYQKYDLSGGYFTSKSLKISLYSFKVGYELRKNLSVSLSANILDGVVAELLSGVLDLDTVSAQIKYRL